MMPADGAVQQPDEGGALTGERQELVESLEALLTTARAQLGDLRTTLATSIAFLQQQSHPQ